MQQCNFFPRKGLICKWRAECHLVEMLVHSMLQLLLWWRPFMVIFLPALRISLPTASSPTWPLHSSSRVDTDSWLVRLRTQAHIILHIKVLHCRLHSIRQHGLCIFEGATLQFVKAILELTYSTAACSFLVLYLSPQEGSS